MGKTKRKFRFYFAWDFDKEEKWINRMSQLGYSLESVGMFTYDFSEEIAGKYLYRLELLKKTGGEQREKQYLRRLEDSGAEKIAENGCWAYYRRARTEGAFAMSAGLASKRRYLGGILKYYLLFGIAVFAALLLNFMVNNGAGGTAHMISMVATLAITFFYVWGLTGLNRTLRRLNQYERQTGIHDEI